MCVDIWFALNGYASLKYFNVPYETKIYDSVCVLLK